MGEEMGQKVTEVKIPQQALGDLAFLNTANCLLLTVSGGEGGNQSLSAA